jgi:HD superfamily phosphohydrolase
MPQWGLTSELRDTEPWGIPADWLAPGKVITDPIHGDVYVNRLEEALIDSPPFQRLRRIRQLGTTHLVYPGATHTRFSHALGALRMVQDLFDIVLGQRDGRHATEDLFSQWQETKGEEWIDDVARAMVVARLGALLHDLCHVAYGHSIEDDLGLLTPHDENADRFDAFWAELGSGHRQFEEVQRILNQLALRTELRPLILAKEQAPGGGDPPRPEEVMTYPFVADMVGNTICADLLDYLARDHLFTGLPAALGTRFMTAFFVTPANEDDDRELPPGPGHYPQRMAIHIRRENRTRADIESELLKHLRFRYELQERVIVHHAKLAADSMVGKMLSLWQESLWVDLARRRGLAGSRHAVDESLDVDAVREAFLRDRGDEGLRQLDQDAEDEIEQVFRRIGDDGLLEWLSQQDTRQYSARHRAAARLAADLLDRRLFKRCGYASPAEHDRLFELYGDRSARRRLERDAAAYAGIDDENVAIWLPDPRMRLKLAEVLVDHGSGIAPFNDYSEKGHEIYQAHRALWGISVYLPEEFRDDGRAAIVLARLAETMGVAWDGLSGQLGNEPSDWTRRLAIRQLSRANEIDDFINEVLAEAPRQAFRGEGTFTETTAALRPVIRTVRRRRTRRQQRN